MTIRACVLLIAIAGMACSDKSSASPFRLLDAAVVDSGAAAGHGSVDAGRPPSSSDSGAAGDTTITSHDAGGICTYDPNADPTPGCVTGAPTMCPGTIPSYRTDVAPAITMYCVACHNTAGMAPDKPFTSYAQVYKTRSTILNRLSRCVMPPACALQPTSEARTLILSWLVCEAPNN